MNRAEATERAARHAVRLFNRASGSDDWDEREEPAKQCWRADVFEVLDASGYPAALDEAAELLHAVADDHEPERDGGTDDRWPMDPVCASDQCGQDWPCNTERARAWLAAHELSERTETT